MNSTATKLLVGIATLAATLIAMATGVDVTLPRVEPEPASGQRGLLGDLAASVRDAAWPSDGGAVATNPAARRLIEASAAELAWTVANRSLTVTAVTPAILGSLSYNSTAGLAVSQPLASLDACIVWRRRAALTDASGRDGTYFINVFHSSVWSMLLLCLLCSVAFLTLLESAHPIGLPRPLAEARRKRHRLRDKPMSPVQVLAFAAGALLLVGYPRVPKATSGRVLALFWWFFAFTVAAAYLAATVLVFLTTRSQPSGSDATLADVLQKPKGNRVVLCSIGNPLCSPLARPELLVGANFTQVATDSVGLQQLLAGGSADMLLLTHQFSCANLRSVDSTRNYSQSIISKASAWVSLAGPLHLIRQADPFIMNLLTSGQLNRLANQHGMAQLYVNDGGAEDGVGKWITEMRHGLPYRIGSFSGPLVLLIIGVCMTICAAVCEFCYYRFFIDVEEMKIKEEEEELDLKERALTIASTMDTYL